MYTEDHEVYFNQQLWDLNQMDDTEVRGLKAEIEKARERTEKNVISLEGRPYCDEDWLRRARAALRYFARDMIKIDERLGLAAQYKETDLPAHVGAGAPSRHPTSGLRFEITKTYEDKGQMDEAFAKEVAVALHNVQPGQKATLKRDRQAIARIKAVLPRATEILGWQRPGHRYSYRSRIKELPGGECLLTIYRFGGGEKS